MGFLDSMLGELVRRETGFNAKPMLRRIGSKRLLMMGGAALAGGLLAQQAQKSQQGTGARSLGGSSGTAVPRRRPDLPPPPSNLPPLPTLPPRPPAPTQAPPLPKGEEGQEPQEVPTELLYGVVRTMVAAALADGELSSAEKAAIENHLGDSGLDDEQRAQVRRDLTIPASPAELAGLLPEGEDPETLLEFAVLVMRADGELGDLELRWLERLAAALGVAEERCEEVVRGLAGEMFGEG